MTPHSPFSEASTASTEAARGIVSTLSNCLTEYIDGNVARMLHDDECGLDGIGEEPTVVFVSSSSATGNYKRLVQTFVSQALSALRSCAGAHAGRCPVETVLLLDEAASLGRNERIVQDLGEMRSEGIRVLWFCQSLLQLQSVSGYSREEAETILDLLKDKVVLSCSNLETARKLSESMGSYTAVAQSTSRTKGVNTGSTGTSEGLVRRPLITPDEIQRWTGRETGALVIHDGVPMAFPSRDVTETFVGGHARHDIARGRAHAYGAVHRFSQNAKQGGTEGMEWHRCKQHRSGGAESGRQLRSRGVLAPHNRPLPARTSHKTTRPHPCTTRGRGPF